MKAYFKQDLQLHRGWQSARQTGRVKGVWGRGPGRSPGRWKFYGYPHTTV